MRTTLGLLLGTCLSFGLLQAPHAQPAAVLAAIQQGNEHFEAEAYKAAQAQYQIALAHFDSIPHPYYQAYLHTWLGELALVAGAPEQAMQQSIQACEILHEHGIADTFLLYGLLLQNIGHCYAAQGDYDMQFRYCEAGQAASLKRLGLNHKQTGWAYLNLGYVYGQRGKWDRCIAYTDTARQIAEQLEDIEGQGSILINLAQAHAEKGDVEQAVWQLRQCTSLPISDDLLAKAYNNLGSIYTDLSDYTTALAYLKKAKHIREHGGKPSDSPLISTLLNIIHLQWKMGQTDSARQSTTELIQRLKQTKPPALWALQLAYNYQAKQLLDQGDAPAALAAVHQAANMASGDNRITTSTQMIEARILLALDRYPEALDAIQLAFGYQVPSFKPTSPLDNPDWRELETVEYAISLFLLKSAVLRAMAKAQKRPELIGPALQALQLGDSAVTNSRLSCRSQASKSFLAAGASELYEAMVDLHYTQYAATGQPEHAEQALLYIEKTKALSVLESLKSKNAQSFHDIDDELVLQERSLREDIEYYQSLLRPHNEAYYSSEQKTVWKDTLYGLLRQQGKLLSKIKEEHKLYYETRLNIAPVEADALRRSLLYPDETFLSYFLGEKYWYALIIDEQQSRILRFAADSLPQQVLRLHEALRMRSDEAYALSHGLYQRLLLPLTPYLKGEKLALVPDGVLAYLPFDQLVVSLEGDRPSYVLEAYSIRRLLSASTAMQHLSAAPSESDNEVFAIAPTFESSSSKPQREATYGSLPGAQEELDTLQQHYAGTYLKGKAATEAAFMKNCGKKQVLHLATHAEIDDRFPTASHLLLGEGQGEDGLLHAYELYSLRIPALLSFLSACETGYGTIKAGEGSMSLAHAFAYAGCPNIVMTLWPLRDRTSPRLVSAYYRYLESGLDKAEAMRQAKLFFLQDDELFSHPYYWSSFVYQGDRLPIPIKAAGAARSTNWWIIMAFAGIAALFWLGARIGRRRR